MSFGRRRQVGTGTAKANAQAPNRTEPPATRRPSRSGISPAEMREIVAIVDGTNRDPPRWTRVTFAANLVGFAVISMVWLAIAVGIGPGVYRDLMHADTYRPDSAIRVIRSECTRFQLLVTNCYISFQDDRSLVGSQTSSFWMLFVSSSNRSIIPMRSVLKPEVVVADYAIEKLANRTVTLVLFLSLLLMPLSIFFWRLITGRYKDGPANNLSLR